MKEYKFSSDWFSRHIPTWNELLLARKKQIHTVLEIGSYEGRSTVWIIDNLLSHPGSQIYCIDIWQDEDIEATFDHNVVLALDKKNEVKVEKLKGSSSVMASRLLSSGYQNMFDLIYIPIKLEQVVQPLREAAGHGWRRQACYRS